MCLPISYQQQQQLKSPSWRCPGLCSIVQTMPFSKGVLRAHGVGFSFSEIFVYCICLVLGIVRYEVTKKQIHTLLLYTRSVICNETIFHPEILLNQQPPACFPCATLHVLPDKQCTGAIYQGYYIHNLTIHNFDGPIKALSK